MFNNQEKIIHRKKECEMLEKFYNLNEGALITITGRRKVGKTTFINYFLKNKDGIVFKFIANNNYSSMENLKLAVNNLKIQLLECQEIETLNDVIVKNVRSWEDFFSYIGLICLKIQKLNINLNFVFDEVAWYSKKNDFLNAFSNCFNNFLFAYSKCKVFLSSSTGSWIRKNILENKGSLYKREFLKPIHLNPFTFNEIFQYCQKINPLVNKETILEYYLMFGGIIKYYQYINLNDSFEKNIDFINKNKNLFINERKILLESLYQKHFILIAENVLKILSRKKSATIIELEEELKSIINKVVGSKFEKEFVERYFENKEMKKFQLYKLCDDLVESGLLKSVSNLDFKTKHKTYILNDLFAYFEYFWDGKNFKNNNYYNNWKGNAFEIFIFNHFKEICEHSNIEFNEDNLFLNWKNKDCQIDLLYKEESCKQNIFHIVECKFFNNRKYLMPTELEKIRNRCYSLLKEHQKDQIRLLLISFDFLNFNQNDFEFPYKRIVFKECF